MSEPDLSHPTCSPLRRSEAAQAPSPGREPWQRRVVASTVADPWAQLEEAACHPDWFAWHDDHRGLTFVAWGAVDRCEPRGAARYGVVRDWSLEVARRFGDAGDELAGVLPLALGGFAFRERIASTGRNDARWRAWPDAAFVIPEHVVAKLPSGATVQATTHPDPGWARPQVSAGAPASTARTGPEESREAYEALVHATVNSIVDGDLVKAVVARSATCEPPPGRSFEPVAVLRALRAGHPSALCFAVGRRGEVFLGASPETLVALGDGRLTTQAVAGTTRAADDRDGLKLRASAKDDHEHALVVQSIETTLGPLCDELVVGSRRLARAGDVHHIVTPVDARPRVATTLLDAVSALHPTAALCGTPREAAAAWLAEREGFDRGWYGAPVGWLGPRGDGVFAVAIRSALLSPHVATAFVGAGVVRGSSPAAEWDETEAKLGAVRRAIDQGSVEDAGVEDAPVTDTSVGDAVDDQMDARRGRAPWRSL